MLAFKMKVPQQELGVDKLLGEKIDSASWGPTGIDLLQRITGMRKRVTEAAKNGYIESGAGECRTAFIKFHELVRQGEVLCKGVSLEGAGLTFRWGGSFEAVANQEPDWSFERACVLFNLAATLSFLATHEDRTTAEGVKAACQQYQQSAGVLNELATIVGNAAWTAPTDLAPDTTSALQTLMLAQAQKTFVEKAQTDGMSDKILTMLNAECAGLYEDAGRRVAEAKARDRPIAAMSQAWLNVIEWNRLLFDGMQHYYMAKTDDAEFKYGVGLARYTYAANKTGEALKSCKAAVEAGMTSEALMEQFNRAHLICLEAYNVAKRDNDSIYHEDVPNVATLPKPQRKGMVKLLVPADLVPDPSFDALIPPSLSRGPSANDGLVAAAASISLDDGGVPHYRAPPAGDSEPPPPSFEEAEEAAVAELVEMGFDRAKAKEALAKVNGNKADAAMLLSG